MANTGIIGIGVALIVGGPIGAIFLSSMGEFEEATGLALCVPIFIIIGVALIIVGAIAPSKQMERGYGQFVAQQQQYGQPQPPIQQPAPQTQQVQVRSGMNVWHIPEGGFKFCPGCGKKNEGWTHCPDCGQRLK